MGTLLYGSPPVPFLFDDRVLVHLQTVILAKLRRGEGFGFHLPVGAALGHGRRTLWMHPSTALAFALRGTVEVAPNPAWLRALMDEANSSRGLSVLPEPPARASAA